MSVDENELLGEACQVLREGGVVACATETLTGLLADAYNRAAIDLVLELKQRPASLPVALLLPNVESLANVSIDVAAQEPTSAKMIARLADAFWPGPLTILVPVRGNLHPALSRDGLIGVRVPGESPALDLVRAFGKPLTATSANLSGQPPAATAAEVIAQFGQRLDVVMPQDAPRGAPSTVVSCQGGELTVLREGAIAEAELRAAVDPMLVPTR